MADAKYTSLRQEWSKHGIANSLIGAIREGEVYCINNGNDNKTQKCHDPASFAENAPLGYQHWKYLLEQRLLRDFGQVLGPTSVSIWVRPFDGKQLVLVGQNRDVYLGPTMAPTYCADSVVFLAWFRKMIQPVVDKWTIIVPGDSEKLEPYNLNPVSALQVYLATRKPPIPMQRIKVEKDEKLLQMPEPQTPQVFLKMADKILKHIDRLTKSLEPLTSLLTETDDEQISELLGEYNVYNRDLVNQVRREMPKHMFKLTEDFLCTSYRTIFALRAIVAILASPKRNVLLVGTEMQREALDTVLPTFGFFQVYPSRAGWASSVQRSSCTVMPRVQSDIAIDKKLPIHYIPEVFLANCSQKNREDDLESMLVPLLAEFSPMVKPIVKPIVIPTDLQLELRGLSKSQLSDFWDRIHLPGARKQAVLDTLSRAGLLAQT